MAGTTPRSRWAYYDEYSKKMQEIQALDKGRESEPLPADMGEIEITPDLARDWILRNRKNRKIYFSVLHKLVEEVKGDRWELNGQTISFKENGELNDGQHRLWAVIIADKPIKSLVVFDVENRAFATVDTGKSRSHADVLTTAGYKYTIHLAAAARWAVAVDGGALNYRMRAAGQSSTMPNEEMLKFARRNPDLRDVAARYIGKEAAPLANLLPPSIAIYAQWVTYERAPRKAAEFWAKLGSGAGLLEGNSILTLRNMLIEERAETRRRLSSPALLSFVIKAWNAWEHGKQLRLLKYMENERFPKWGDNPETSYVLPALERALAGGHVPKRPKRLDDRFVWQFKRYENGGQTWTIDIPASLEKNGLTLKEIRNKKNKFARGTVGNALRASDARQTAHQST